MQCHSQEKIADKCSINSSDPDFRHHVQELIMGGSRLLYMQLNIKNSPKTRIKVLSFVLLAMECIVFFAEYVIYTVIGIILNASFALKYVSVLFMIAIYARECFGSVTNKYCCFNADIHDFVLGKVKKEMKVVAAQDEEEQKNTAFTLPQTPEANQDNNQVVAPSTPVLRVSDGVPEWRTHHLVIFLDREDTSYLTQKFFFDTVNMPHSGGPGNLLSNILSAFAQFMVIILFLLFVILIVMIFGDEYKVSGFNQMIATLVTGFLPWVFRNILFKPHADLSVDTDNVNFQNSFEAVVRNHKQSWELSDLSVDKMEPIMSSSKEVDSSIIASHDDVDEKSKMVDKETKSEDFSETSEMISMGSIKDTKIDLIINTARNLNKAFQNDEKV
ncbi:hypothetical protein FSP39_021876 [Pinctada imbricata]|uniref:Uncharacterized protein n=1 Tax=Pinctada imbricata TaxID=66713 RepID=A0AA89C7B1_PINIB|nr:hypothetical protein FSP39_021876 [Pinctada imbricata]